jgi:hypothetical protein
MKRTGRKWPGPAWQAPKNTVKLWLYTIVLFFNENYCTQTTFDFSHLIHFPTRQEKTLVRGKTAMEILILDVCFKSFVAKPDRKISV